MTVIPAAPPVNFNLAVETLKRTLRQEKDAATALSQAQAPPAQTGHDVDVSGVGSDSDLGQSVNMNA